MIINNIHPHIKALILDFDMTLFDTRADNDVRKAKKGKDIDWDEVHSVIPQYRLYEGWREVFAWCKANNIKIGIVSTAKTELINRTLTHFDIECDAVVGWQLFHRKPSAKLVEMILKKLNVKCDEVISIGDSIIDKQMSDNGGVRFIGAIWDSEDIDELQSCVCITTPSDIMTVTI
jgi:HAD superfamily hydrolase (TIGR01549 family)